MTVENSGHTAPAPQAVLQVPDGWQLVPKEPTTEMECAPDHEDCATPDAARAAYRAMLAAAPPSPLDIITVDHIHDLAVSELCERCQGNGEIVTDWDRYLKPTPGDEGDEAVTDCPDCDGTGRAVPPALQPLVEMDDEDRTPAPEGYDAAQWRKADEVHHATALVADDTEYVKIIYAALTPAPQPQPQPLPSQPAERDDRRAEVADRLRKTTEAMAHSAVVDMDIWDRHSNACLNAADEIDTLTAERDRLQQERDDYMADYFRRHNEAADNMTRALMAEADRDRLKARVEEDLAAERDFLSSEARRYASHYPEASDGRNTFIIFAEMIEARAARQALKGEHA